MWRGRVSHNVKITLIPIPIPKTNGSSDNRGSAGGSPTSRRPGLAILDIKFNSEALCGEVGFPTTGIFNNFLTLSHRQIAMDAVGNQRAEARPLMESLRVIKNRIRSITNTAQITKAMEMVAASKMRKAQEYALGSRFYVVKALELLSNVVQSGGIVTHYLLNKPETKKICFLVITSDKGLCGGANSVVLGRASASASRAGKDNVDIVAVGKKGADFFRHKGFNVIASFSGFGDYAKLADTLPVARLLMDYQKEGRYAEVTVFYNKFISTLKQTVFAHTVFPFDLNTLRDIAKEIIPETGRYANFRKDFLQNSIPEELPADYIFEPSSMAVLDRLLPQLFKIEIHSIILEANASEHSARMVAMKNASDNAKGIIGDLKLIYNTARQAAITKELSEISAGAEALKS